MIDISLVEKLILFFKTFGLGIIWILIVFVALRLILDFLAKKIIRTIIKSDIFKKNQLEKKVQTILSLVLTLGKLVIYVVILIMLLNLFGADLKPVLAGAGVLSLILGFGAQSIIKDFIAGIIIIFENQYNIGDEIKIGDLKGKVIKITFRSTILKDSKNKIYYIANGSINNIINLSQKNIFK